MPNDYPLGSFVGVVPQPASGPLLDDLARAGVVCDTSTTGRAAHGRDWWPLSIHDVAQGRVPHWPGVVVRPVNAHQVRRVIEIASRHRCPLTAQGGRSSVNGGAVATTGGIALDLTSLSRVLDIDTVSGTVTVEAGVFGPALESAVREHGWTVGHFPQSFALATVGGWLACRGAGQYSNRYGKIEDMVRALTVVLANGEVVELGGGAPRQAVGPDLMQLFVGSEGTFGVITQATLVLHRAPLSEQRAAYAFDSFAEGLKVCRRIMQRDAHPAVLRLYDRFESARLFDVTACVLIVLEEGDGGLVAATMRLVEEECHAGEPLDPQLVARWLEHRNDVNTLGALWERGIAVDTIEVAAPWAKLEALCENVLGELHEIEATVSASVHQSHAYLDGACVYFTFAGRFSDDPTAYYRRAWDAATRRALESGGSLSHHHGIGRNRARFVAGALASGFPLLESLKATLDPLNIMNPGVLGLGGPAW